MQEQVILVDDQDNEIGTCEKLKAHREGLLHRAFSAFIFNSENKMLIHQRALGKYHSEGLWTNACCSHPRPNETVLDAVKRRLPEEMGISCDLQKAFCVCYNVQVSQNLIEHEYDHVFIGTFNGDTIRPNPDEVAAYRWIAKDDLLEEMSYAPQTFTKWFHLALPKVLNLQNI